MIRATVPRLKKLFEPRDGYERLVWAVYDFQSSAPPLTWEELAERIRSGTMPASLTDEDRVVIDMVLDSIDLGGGRADRLRRYYGIGREPETIERLAAVYKINHGHMEYWLEQALTYFRHMMGMQDWRAFSVWGDFRDEVRRCRVRLVEFQVACCALERRLGRRERELARYKKRRGRSRSAAQEFSTAPPNAAEENQDRIYRLLTMAVEQKPLGLSIRTVDLLRAAGIEYVGDLVQKTEDEVRGYEKFTAESIQELTEFFESCGLYWGMSVVKYGYVSPMR